MKSLFSEFAPTSKKEWLDKVEQDLKGKPIGKLSWNFEGTEMSPFYHSDDPLKRAEMQSSIKENNQWIIGEKIDVSGDESNANLLARKSLEGGATGLLFDCSSLKSPCIAKLLEGIQLEWIETDLIVNASQVDYVVEKLSDFVVKKGFDALKIKGSIRTIDGTLYSEQLKIIHDKLPLLKTHLIHCNQNINTNEENFYTKALTNTLCHLEDPLGQTKNNSLLAKSDIGKIQFKTRITDNYFANIAYIRALRQLVLECVPNEDREYSIPIEVHIQPHNEQNDENKKIIQANAQAMSAVIGGANRIFISLHDEQPSSFQRRIARNISHLLALESHMTHVRDPASGSYFIEKMTRLMVEKAKNTSKHIPNSKQRT